MMALGSPTQRVLLPLGLLLVVGSICLLYPGRTDAYQSTEALMFDKKSFAKTVSQKPYFVFFHAPWCMYCEDIMPAWNDLYEKYELLGDTVPLKLMDVDCTVQIAICNNYDITGFPTFKLFSSSNPDGLKYRGERSFDALERWLENQLRPSSVWSYFHGSNDVCVVVFLATTYFYFFHAGAPQR